MQFTTTLITAILATLAAAESGFTVPSGQADGVYSVHRNSTGHEVHNPVDTAFGAKFRREASPAETISDLAARGDGAGCNNEALNGADTDKANAMLDAQCGGWKEVDAYKNIYSVSGGVVAYFCSQSGGGYGCGNGDRAAASRSITAKCGQYQAGWMSYSQRDSGLGGSQHWAYGYQAATDKFCGDGIGK